MLQYWKYIIIMLENKSCKYYGTMTLTPTEDKDWEVLDWCFCKECAIYACSKDCVYKNKEE